MMDIGISEILINVQAISRHKFPGKRKISKPQISREISRPDLQGGNSNSEL